MMKSSSRHDVGNGKKRSGPKDALCGLALAMLAALTFVNSLHGEFVYDDERQIVGNTLIQDPQYYATALTSDVWAFKGGDDEARSNYWRPTFVGWLILNHTLFGLESTVPWHAANILLHALVTWLAFAFMRRLGVERAIAGVIGLVFAVHPAHSETVAWISGSPDLLLAASLLGSLCCVDRLARSPASAGWAWRAGHWAAAIALYVLAQGAKEIAVFTFVLVALLVMLGAPRDQPVAARLRRGVRFAAPFLALAVAYVIARHAVIGATTRAVWGEGSALSVVLSWPMIGAFYLRQIVFPAWIGPSYPLRPVTDDTIGAFNFLLPLLLCGLFGFWALRQIRRRERARFALALFVLLLIPTLNIRAFIPEQIVHDRYLYLPLLGFLMLVVPAVTRAVERRHGPRGRRTALVVLAACCLPLALQTVRYNRAWTSNLALWEWGVRSDPSSAFNHNQRGAYLVEADLNKEAVAAFDRSIAIRPGRAHPHMGRADAFYAMKAYEAARESLHTALEITRDRPGSFERGQIYRRLARTFEAEQRFQDALGWLEEGRHELPDRRAALSRDIAILHFQAGAPEAALQTLESVRERAAVEPSPEARLALYQLGLLYHQLGRSDAARDVWQEYLEATATMSDPQTRTARERVQQALGIDRRRG